MTKLMTFAKRFAQGEDGATMVEYALMVALIAVASIAAVTGIATALNTSFNNTSSQIK